MERPLLFAETPRAGRWNHRFLVPEELTMTEEQLAEEASRARQQHQGSNYLAVVRQVEQPSSGRTADELLVLHGVAEHLDAATRRELLKRLEARLDDLDRLVQTLDWEREGKRLLVRRQELAAWFDSDFAAELAACRGPAEGTAPRASQDSPALAARAVASSRRWMMRATGIALAALGLWLWRPWSSPPEPTPASVPSSVAQREHAASINDAELQELESALRELADHWRLPQRRDSLDALGTAVVQKLERDLALGDIDASLPVQQRLPDMIGSLAAVFFRSAAHQAATVVGQLQDAAFQTRLLSVYRGRQLDYLAPLQQIVAPDDYDRQSHLRALEVLCAARSKQEVASYREIVAAARQLTLAASTAESLTDDTDLVQRLHDAARSSATLQWPAQIERANAPLELAILDESDAAAAAVLLRWLGMVAANETTGLSEEDTANAVRRFVDQKRDLLEVLAAQQPPGRRRHAIQTASLLLSVDRLLAQTST